MSKNPLSRCASPLFPPFVWALVALASFPTLAAAAQKPNDSPPPRSRARVPQAPQTLRAWLLHQLPEKLQKLRPGVSTSKQVTTVLGKAPEQPSPSLSYYETAGLRFDTNLTWKNGKLESLTFVWSKAPTQLAAMTAWIPSDKIDAATRAFEKALVAGEVRSDQPLVLNVPEEGVSLEFSALGSQPLRKVTLTRPPVPTRTAAGGKREAPSGAKREAE